MRVCIHRGTREIGGTCVEIESQGKRIVLDIGLPLDAEPADVPLPPVAGFAKADPSLLGVVISHPHLDHYGLAHKLPPGTPILIGSAAERILKAASVFVPGDVHFDNVVHLQDRTPVTLGPFAITPFLMDHSAYDAYAVLVEADGRRLFYSGDLRAHGRKGKLFERLVAHPPENVDVLLMEGSTIGRTGEDNEYPTEAELEKRFEQLFAEANGLSLVWCSGQNIDRIVTIYRAARHVDKQLVVDMYTASVLRAIGNPKLPQPGFAGFRVFLPWTQKQTIRRKKVFDLAASFKTARIYPENLAGEAGESVMLFRPSMGKDLQEAECLAGARMIYSLWGGYLKEDRQQGFLTWLERHGIPMTHCHTSGHAPIKDLKRLAKAIAPRILVPIHSSEPGRFKEFFENVEAKEDGQWWSVSRRKRMDRAMPPEFFKDLESGPLKWVVDRALGDSTLCLELRGSAVNLYYRGGSLLKIVATGSGYEPKFDSKYCEPSLGCSLPDLPCLDDAKAWNRTIPLLKDIMDKWFGKNPKLEREFQQLIVRENNMPGGIARSTDYYILDMEYADGADRFDMVAVRWPSRPENRKDGTNLRLVLLEMKYADGAHRGNRQRGGAAGLRAHLQGMLGLVTDKTKLAHLKDYMLEVFRQKHALGLIDSGKEISSFDDHAADIAFIIANHDPEKTALLDELKCMRDTLPGNCDPRAVLFLRASYFGYGLYDNHTLALPDMIAELERVRGT